MSVSNTKKSLGEYYKNLHLVRYNLKLAKLVAPKRNWGILTSDLHSTVWDGECTIFEFNFYAFGIPADKAFERAAFGSMKEQVAA